MTRNLLIGLARACRYLTLIAGLSITLIWASSPSAFADIGDTQVTLSCNDGHSVAVALDPTMLLELTAAVQALTGDPTGLSCTLDPADPPPASWTVYDYNPSGQAIAPRVSPASMPATTTGNTTYFPFKPDIYTALLTTTDSNLTGDLSARTLNVTVSVTDGAGTFQDQHNGGCSPDEKYVRFYFVSPRASGTTGTGTTGFYTQFWWSNPVHVPLATDPQDPLLISQIVNAPSMWSDWNGKRGSDSAEVTEKFLVAIHNVKTVGLSFGGGCFFENGVTTSDGSGTFQSTFTESF
jgi:hypothetical protein